MTAPLPADDVLTLTAADGVHLEGVARGPVDAPVVVLVHGYPDDRHVWDGVVAVLADRYRLVTYDVRGAGRSGAPRDRAGYRLDQLAADLDAVIEAVSPERPVHLVAHDWGSIQTWHAVTGHGAAARAASYTSISGPCLDHAARWLRGARPGERPPGTPAQRLRQAASSYYTGLFQLPVLPELIWRSPLGPALLRRLGAGGSATRDLVNGLELYRANMLPRFRHPEPRTTTVPVQVLTPTRDAFVGAALQDAAGFGTTDLAVHAVDGGHWVVRTRPEAVADRVDTFVRAIAARGTG